MKLLTTQVSPPFTPPSLPLRPKDSPQHSTTITKVVFVLSKTPHHNYPSIPITMQFKACMTLDCSNTGIRGLNSAQGKDVCPCFFVLCCPV
jgi:hypothetical protein